MDGGLYQHLRTWVCPWPGRRVLKWRGLRGPWMVLWPPSKRCFPSVLCLPIYLSFPFPQSLQSFPRESNWFFQLQHSPPLSRTSPCIASPSTSSTRRVRLACHWASRSHLSHYWPHLHCSPSAASSMVCFTHFWLHRWTDLSIVLVCCAKGTFFLFKWMSDQL